MIKSKITVLDLGYGNFKSLLNAFNYLKISSEINNRKKILNSDMLFLPGVGSYDTAINYLKNNLVDVINEATKIKKRKFWVSV